MVHRLDDVPLKNVEGHGTCQGRDARKHLIIAAIEIDSHQPAEK